MEDTLSVVATALLLIALAAAMGGAAGMLWLLPPAVAEQGTALLGELRLRLWQLLGWCLPFLTAATLLELLLRTATMSDTPLQEASSQIGTVLWETHYGALWMWRMGALLLLWIVWGVQRRALDQPLFSGLGVLALIAIAFTLSAAGHAGDDGLLTAVNAANTLHIVGALLWGGGIIAAAVIILPLLLRNERAHARELIAVTSLRLSTLAAIALAMVLLPGIYNAWLQIGSWDRLFTTVYGQVLLAKIALVGVMMLLGALNRYRYVPAAQEYAGRPLPRTLFPLPSFMRTGGTLSAVLHFLRSLRWEMMLLIAVLALAAALSQQTPAIHADMEHHH